MVLTRSTKTIVIGLAAGMALGALTNMGLLPLGGLMNLLAGGGGGFGGPAIHGDATEATFETYEVPRAMMALYNNAGHDQAGYRGAYLQAYGIKVADAIRQACGPASVFTTADIKSMENKLISDTLSQVTVENGLNALAGQIGAWGDILSNPQNLQKYVPEYDPEQIPMTAQADGYRFSQEYGCEGGTMDRFAKNTRAYLSKSLEGLPGQQ